MKTIKAYMAPLMAVSMLATATAPTVFAAGNRSAITTVYVTRHAEKQDVLDESGNPSCNSSGSRCAEELSAIGEARAQQLTDWLEGARILPRITDVISSDKQRTRQTVEPTAARLIARGVDLQTADSQDMIVDGVRQVPAGLANTDGNEVNGNSVSVVPTVEAIKALEPGSVALVAAHSGTIYRIMGGEDTDGDATTGEDETVGLGIDTNDGDNSADVTLFPKKDSDGKVPTFGDLWKIVINTRTGVARVVWRINLQSELSVQNQTVKRGRGPQKSRTF